MPVDAERDDRLPIGRDRFATILRRLGLSRSGIRMTDLLRNLLLIIVIAMFSASAFLVFRTADSTLKAIVIEGNALLANSIAHEVDQLLDGYRRTLALFGSASQRSEPFLDLVIKTHDAFEQLVLLDLSGRVVASSAGSVLRGYDMSRRNFFAEPMRSGRWYVSPSFVSTKTYSPTVALALPFEDGIAVGFLNLASLAAYIQGLGLGRGDVAAVTDSLGYYIAHSVRSKVERHESGAVETIAEGGYARVAGDSGPGDPRVLVSSASIPLGGWTVVVTRSSEAVRGPIVGAAWIILAMLVLTLLAVAFTITAVLRSVARDIAALAARTSAIAAGDYGQPFEYAGYSDLKLLADDFARMAEAVRGREQSLLVSERDLKRNLAEKEVLIKEIHHRVKNNLQLVVSLLSLQSTGTEGGDRSELFDDSINRVRSMALIHEMLYQSEDLSRISLSAYIRTLVESLAYSYSSGGRQAALAFEMDDLYLDIDLAIPCGIIVNEIVTNSLKHAAKAGDKVPEISVRLREHEGSTASLVIADDGPGLPADLDVKKAHSLGLKLVVSLVAQIHGTWVVSGFPGTRWAISFPIGTYGAEEEVTPTSA